MARIPRFVRALLAFLALPGLVAFAVPALLVWPDLGTRPPRPLGLFPFIAGVLLLLWCVRDFYVAGKGTLAPWDPPQNLVIVGLYRISRNPMYIAVTLVLIGWAISYRSLTLAVYTLAVMVMFELRVVFGEEPWLARTHQDGWRRYAAQVPRWLFHRARTFLVVLLALVAAGCVAGWVGESLVQASATRRFPAGVGRDRPQSSIAQHAREVRGNPEAGGVTATDQIEPSVDRVPCAGRGDDSGIRTSLARWRVVGRRRAHDQERAALGGGVMAHLV